MQAITYDAYGSVPQLVERPRPECPTNGVVIRVHSTGVCRSDWHAWQGHDPVPLPMVPGHEFAGVISEVGSKVTSFAIGDRVTVPFVVGCGECEWCASGNAQVCPNQQQPGFTMPGSFAEKVAIPAAELNVVRLPDELDFDTAASLGCRFATAYRALRVHGRVQAGDWVSVHGCGGVGLSAVMIAAALGAHVIAVDVTPAALELARSFGAEHTVAAGEDAADQVREISGGGTHVSLDAVGLSATAIASVRSLRPRGRHVQVGLLLGDHATPALPMGLVISQELELYGSHGMAAKDYPGMLELVASGQVRPDLLVGTTIALAEAPAALAAMSEPATSAGVTVIRVVN